MTTHNLMFLPFILLLLLFSLFLFLTTKDKKRFCLQAICSLIVAAALSAFFWAPSLIEKKYTIVDDLLLVNLADYKIHFVYPQQLWNWTWGFGGSAEGIMDGISFKIGKIHILISVFTFMWAFYYLFILRFSKNNFILKSIAVYFILFVLSAFMTTMYSRIIWEVLPPLAYLQFPWRFLAFTSLFSSILVGGFIYLIRVQTFKLIATLLLVILVLIPNLKLFKPQFYRLDLTDKTATSRELINWEVSRSSFEYIPKGVKLKKNDIGANSLDISREDIGQARLEITSGNAQFNTLKSDPDETALEVDARTQAIVTANIFDFPNWSVYLDNQKITHANDNKFKLISFTIPKGVHKVTIKFENTNTRALANMISLLSLLALAGYLVKKWQTQTTN